MTKYNPTSYESQDREFLEDLMTDDFSKPFDQKEIDAMALLIPDMILITDGENMRIMRPETFHECIMDFYQEDPSPFWDYSAPF